MMKRTAGVLVSYELVASRWNIEQANLEALLSPRCERTCHRRHSTQKCNELPPPHGLPRNETSACGQTNTFRFEACAASHGDKAKPSRLTPSAALLFDGGRLRLPHAIRRKRLCASLCEQEEALARSFDRPKPNRPGYGNRDGSSTRL
jgi:hypothetical protein